MSYLGAFNFFFSFLHIFLFCLIFTLSVNGHAFAQDNVKRPQLSIGDSYVVETRTDRGDKYIRSFTVVSNLNGIVFDIKNIANGEVSRFWSSNELNPTAYRDQQGMEIRHEPALRYFYFPLFPGQSWSQRSKRYSLDGSVSLIYKISRTVGGFEKLKFGNYIFKTIKIVYREEIFDEKSGITVLEEGAEWYCDDINSPIHSSFSRRNLSNNITVNISTTVVSYNSKHLNFKFSLDGFQDNKKQNLQSNKPSPGMDNNKQNDVQKKSKTGPFSF